MAAKQVIIGVAVLAALACVCSAVHFTDPESYWCYDTHVSRAAADGPVGLTANNDELCKKACKQEKYCTHYLPGNWAIFEGKDQVKCCCASRKPTFGKWYYNIRTPVIPVTMSLNRAEEVRELFAHYEAMQKK